MRSESDNVRRRPREEAGFHGLSQKDKQIDGPRRKMLRIFVCPAKGLDEKSKHHDCGRHGSKSSAFPQVIHQADFHGSEPAAFRSVSRSIPRRQDIPLSKRQCSRYRLVESLRVYSNANKMISLCARRTKSKNYYIPGKK